MKARVLGGLATVLLVAAALTGQTSPAPTLSTFAGTWKADFHKQTWLLLTLVENKAGLSGTLMHSTEISADDEGDITKVSDDMSTDKITQVELRDDILHIDAKDEDGNVDRYELRLTGADSAELQPVTDSGAAAPKAFKLRRSPAPVEPSAPK